MELLKVVDNEELQVYSIIKPTNDFKSTFPKQFTIVTYNYNGNIVILENTDTLPWNVFNGLSYVFSYKEPKTLTKLFTNITGKRKQTKTKKFKKYCGLNAVEQTLFSNEEDVVLSLMTLNDYEYNPHILNQYVYITTNYDEMINVNKNELIAATNKIIVEDMVKLKSFVDFIVKLKESFPLNYGATIRRFNKKITLKDITTIPKNINDNKLQYYIGYDQRNSNKDEIEMMRHIESICYNNDIVYVYETYNNPIKSIMKQCDDKKIPYKKIYKKIIQISGSDYDKLEFVKTIADFI